MHPLAVTEAMGAVDAELKQVAFQALVYHGQVRYIADMHMVGHLFRYARYTWHKSRKRVKKLLFDFELESIK